ncbi:hypothetical protein [Croceicoccus bisphenolivorans]|uniref:hypothetical protein n=1 Tax=Croceicoccus bisphenolivorans TaxID=1783232 RepID=UPI000833B495|nr:hypothetical protein [Croceicoccus bisphenolivorans]
MINTNAVPAGAEPRARAEELLARYPDLSDQELGELLLIFRKRLSAMDQALIASEDRLAGQYVAFKREQLERFKPRDLLNAVLFVVLVVGPIVGIAFAYGG